MGWGRDYGSDWAPYVSVGQKLAQGRKLAETIAKKQGRKPSPVKIEGRKIAKTFWGVAWCDNLNAYSDFSNRLPRGATYVRNGSVADLVIKSRNIEAVVAGSKAYTVRITIDPLGKSDWKKIQADCSASIESLFDLMAGKFSNGVMQRLTQKADGLFPSPKQIKMSCSCPDYSYCCKHIAAVMYGVGNRLDSQPELLFLLRDVNHLELVSAAVSKQNLNKELSGQADASLEGVDLGELFGIDLNSESAPGTTSDVPKSKSKRGAKKTAAAAAAAAETTSSDAASAATSKIRRTRNSRATSKSKSITTAKSKPQSTLASQTKTTRKATSTGTTEAAAPTTDTKSSSIPKPSTRKKSSTANVEARTKSTPKSNTTAKARVVSQKKTALTSPATARKQASAQAKTKSAKARPTKK